MIFTILVLALARIVVMRRALLFGGLGCAVEDPQAQNGHHSNAQGVQGKNVHNASFPVCGLSRCAAWLQRTGAEFMPLRRQC